MGKPTLDNRRLPADMTCMGSYLSARELIEDYAGRRRSLGHVTVYKRSYVLTG